MWDKPSLMYRYRVVEINITPEIEVFHMLFYRSLSIFSMTSLKQYTEYFYFRCKSSWTSI